MWKAVGTLVRRCRVKTLKSFGSVPSDGLRISVGDQNGDVARTLAVAFADVDAVEVVEGNLLDLSCDAIVSPANSFGNMGGGIDQAIDAFHQGAAQDTVVAAIAEQFCGELPVGAALIVSLPRHPFSAIVVAPTMRIPGNVGETINAYLSLRAALIAILKHNATGHVPIRSLAVPGLCTGVGGMPYEQASEQMRTAYDSIIGGRWREVRTSSMAPYVLENRPIRRRR